MMILPVIMAGGSGSRLWPLSRSLYPKQFISLASDKTMLQQTILRLNALEHQSPLVICNEAHRFIVAEQLRQQSINHGGIILEPIGRNTAPAIALAALHAVNQDKDPLLLVLAADHVINSSSAFVQAVEMAIISASNDKLVTFGVVPSAPETGYGYIKKGVPNNLKSFTVEQFVEKPDSNLANQYVENGDYLWNSGIFLFKASIYLRELKRHRPDIYQAAEAAISNTESDLDFIRVNEKMFINCPADSIDYAVMEKTSDAVVVPMDAGWSDVGSFSSLWDISKKDSQGNVVKGDVITYQTSGSYINSHSKLVATVGVEDLVIVETKDAVLVVHKDQVQSIKEIVRILKSSGRSECVQHREVYRPWGSHDEIARGERFHVKHLIVKPGERTALQMHHHRAEHWVVVQGTAKVTNGDKTYLVAENESTYIPLGSTHRIENPGKVELHLIEVRSGNYLEEDDVVRLEEYGVGY